MAGLNPNNYGLQMKSPYFGQSYGGYMPEGEDEEAKKAARLQALASIGQMAGGSRGGGVAGGALSGAGTGFVAGNAIAPGVGGLIGAGIGGLVGAVGAGIQGSKEEEAAKEATAREDRKLDLYEKGQNNDQFNAERGAGLEGLKYLAGIRTNAIQNRNRSLFKNDLMRVIGQGV